MTKVKDILNILNEFAPADNAEGWDNVGLLVGDEEKKVKKVLVALDITLETVLEAKDEGADLIVAHHPLIYKPMYNIRENNRCDKIVRELIKSDISAICMHTNLDVAEGGVNDELASVLSLRHIAIVPKTAGLLRYGYLPEPMSVKEFVSFVSNILSCPVVRYNDTGKDISLVAVGGGACGDYMESAAEFGCDAFVSADLKYNVMLDASYLNICALDAGHFCTERPVCRVLAEKLCSSFEGIKVKESTHIPNIKGFIRNGI